MKFRWKIFFIFTALITVVFGVFGIWMVSTTFQSSLDREVERGNSENQMLKFAFEMSLNSWGEEYLVMEDKVIKDIAKSLKNSVNGGGSYIRVYDGNENVLFSNVSIKSNSGFIDTLGDANCGYKITKEKGDEYYLSVVGQSNITDNVYYLENIIEITHIYEEREYLFYRYRLGMLVLLIATGCITLVLSQLLTRPVEALSRVTRKFTKGDYKVRAEYHGENEVGQLTRDFNDMADHLSQKMEELSQTARRQEDFTASFAHELKTPLTSIIGYADMLRTMNLNQEEIMETSNYIYSQGKRLETLSFKLLELIVSGKQDYELRPVKILEFLDELLRIVHPSLEKKHVHLDIHAEDGIVYGEADLLFSLMINLVDNARKAVQEGGMIRIDGKRLEDGYRLQVVDDGCGIPKEELQKITEAFYMVDKSRARKEGGAGLGMTLCRRIVEIHHARWQIESIVGIGTAISIEFSGKGGEAVE